MPSKKNQRRERVLESMGVQLADKTILPRTAARLLYEAQRIKFYLDGGKKKKKATLTKFNVSVQDKWYIDIYAVQLSTTTRAIRRKNKGKSRKKLKKKRQTVFLKSVVAQPGMITNYLEGRMGLSPKHHAFKMRREDAPRQ